MYSFNNQNRTQIYGSTFDKSIIKKNSKKNNREVTQLLSDRVDRSAGAVALHTV